MASSLHCLENWFLVLERERPGGVTRDTRAQRLMKQEDAQIPGKDGFDRHKGLVHDKGLGQKWRIINFIMGEVER